ncbi:SDR family oxidoreductase [Rugosimonospora acidiphila]|uniref:SDR family oxidoreductase n=1 Tax=Rugosimonospora acidiphila TaxID=556531 RepID=A0ABP9RG20_9ACTN
MPPARTALVTGATAGIGAAFARRLAAEGRNLTLVARNESRLAEFAAELSGAHGVDVDVLPADLSTIPGCAAVEERLRDPDATLDILINNAGTSVNGSFLRTALLDEERMLDLNVRAVLRLTHSALPGMVRRGGGDIVNVASVSGFGTVMAGSTYPASKSWVINFSESLALAVRGSGVRVLALCPGYTRTEFHDRAGIDMSGTPGWMWLAPGDVVDGALRDLRRGRLVSVPGWRYKAMVFGMRHAPVALVRRLAPDTRGRTPRPDPP